MSQLIESPSTGAAKETMDIDDWEMVPRNVDKIAEDAHSLNDEDLNNMKNLGRHPSIDSLSSLESIETDESKPSTKELKKELEEKNNQVAHLQALLKEKDQQLAKLDIKKKAKQGEEIFLCKSCGAMLASQKEIFSENFQGRTGPALLFSQVFDENIVLGKPEDREMLTGKHTVADVNCNDCGNNVGWKYINASEESQKYKVGKVILEKGLTKKGIVKQWCAM